MTDEEKKAADTAQQEPLKAEEEKTKADEEATEDEVIEDETSEDEDKSKDIDNDIDYEAELKKEREAREAAERALANKRFKAAEKKRKTEDEEYVETDEEDEDLPLTKAGLQKILAEERQFNQKNLQRIQAEEIAKSLTGSEAEKNLVLEIHKNRTFPSHLSLSEQLEESYVIANRKKLVGERNEAMRALKGKDGVNKNPAGAHRDSAPSKEPKISPQDATAFKAAGFVWNGVSRNYEKKLPNGDLLVRDSKTKQTRLIKKAK